jgi:hypothetical protein
MTLNERKSNLSLEDQKVYEDYFEASNSNLKFDEKSESKVNENVIKDVYENINKSKKNNINDAQEEINNINGNEKKKIINYENKFETNIDEAKKNDLPNSKISILPSNKRKIFFKIKGLDGQNQSINFNIKEKKRGRIKKSNDHRFHSKNAKDNIELKIHGLFIDSCRSFINKKLKKKILKKISYKEKRKFRMDQKLKDIYGNVPKKYGKNYNKNIIDQCDPKLKEIFELPMYKAILAISGVKIIILKGLEHEYNHLKDQRLLKEDDDYINLFNEREANVINFVTNKYPINEDIDINFISNNNAKILEVNPFSSILFNEKRDKLIDWSKSEFSIEGITKNKTLDSKKNNDKNLVTEELSWQIPNISNTNDKKLDINDLFSQIPDKFKSNNAGDSESSSSKYSLINIQPENDDIL